MDNKRYETVDSLDSLKEAIARVRAAQETYATFTQEQVDKIFFAAATAANMQKIPLARLAVEETGMGLMEDKVIKNNYAAEYIYNAYRDSKTCGVIEQDKQYGFTKIAEPIGLICAIIPTTNPTSTAIFKCLLALKTRNGIIISPHHRAKRSTIAAAKIVLEAAVEAGLSLACGRPGFVTELQAAARAVGKAAHIHIKVDTGLHRIGFVPGEELGAFVAELRAAGDDIVVDGVFSHFSAPESLECDEEEYARFLEGIAQLESAGVQIPFKHISCSAASERYPKFDMDAVRIGRRLYMDAPDEPLGTIKELASWRSYVAAVHERRAGDRLGYGEGLTLDKDTRVATVGIGYGDGLALSFAEVNAPVLICGKIAHVIAVFMDQCLVDVTGIDCVPGDEVTIFGYDGHGGYISSQSQALLTDALEGCGITSGLSTRVARVYIG